MVKMTKNLPFTFSKRKSTLFKKANELSTLCGAEVTLIVFSPGGKAFSFGHPNLDVLLNRNNAESVQSSTNFYLQRLNEKFTKVMAEKEQEKKIKDQYHKIMRDKRINRNPKDWSENPPEELNLTQAIQMEHVVKDLKKKVDDLLSQSHPNYDVGSSSNAAPGTIVHDGNNIYTSQDVSTVMGMNTYDPNMISTPNHMLPFGYNHDDNNNVAQGFVSDYAMNPMSGYNNHSQIQNQEFEQDYPRYGSPYY